MCLKLFRFWEHFKLSFICAFSYKNKIHLANLSVDTENKISSRSVQWRNTRTDTHMLSHYSLFAIIHLKILFQKRKFSAWSDTLSSLVS
jgi:hypothetical protein